MGNTPQKGKAAAISTRQCLKSYWGLSLARVLTALPSSLSCLGSKFMVIELIIQDTSNANYPKKKKIRK